MRRPRRSPSAPLRWLCTDLGAGASLRAAARRAYEALLGALMLVVEAVSATTAAGRRAAGGLLSQSVRARPGPARKLQRWRLVWQLAWTASV